MDFYINNKHHLKIKNILIIFSFIVFSFINVALISVLHRLPNADDIWFHWQEISELLKSNSLFPQYALNSFSHSGSAVPTMYPYIFLYPFVIIFHFVKSMATTTYIMFAIDTFISLLISYYSSLRFSKHKSISYLFALMYSLSFPLFLNTFKSYAVGMNNAFIFMPLVLFGFIYWLKNKQWIMLSIGMSLLICSDVIIAALTPCFLLLWLLYNIKKLSKGHFINLIKAIGLTLITTAYFWLPALKLFMQNDLKSMKANNLPWFKNSKGTDLAESFHSAISTSTMTKSQASNTFLMTIYVAIGLIIGILCFKKLNRILKQSCIFSIIILLISSNICPWAILNKTPLGVIQMPWRLYLIPQVLLTYIFASYISKKIKNQKFNKFIPLIGIVIAIIGLQVSNQSAYISNIGHTSISINGLFKKNPKGEAGINDYYPANSMIDFNNIVDHDAIQNNGHKYKTKVLKNNTFAFNNTHSTKSLSLPFIYYYGTIYKCYINHKFINTRPNSNQLMTIDNIPKGHYDVHIEIPLNKLTIFARTISLISMIIYVLLVIKYIKYSKKD